MEKRNYLLDKFKKHARIFWSLSLALVGIALSRLAYFQNYPLLELEYLGEAIEFIALFFFFYFLGKTIATAVGSWFETFIINTFKKVVNDVWAVQINRIVEEMKKDREEKKVQKEKDEKEKLQLPVEYKSTINGIVLDTSAIIDGRILGVIKAGFLDGLFIVPQNVINELQFMADKSNKLKREKGRRGLDVLKDIRKAVGKKNFMIAEMDTKPEEVDHSLIYFCKKNKTKVATVDFNLNKAAQVAGVKVLNINQLANEIKLNVLPGEVMMVKLVQAGKDDGQAVGYLEDGTMIVVRDGSNYIGEHKEVLIQKVIQTNAGRMIFAVVGETAESTEGATL